jgi:hypothetical protein
MNSGGSQWTGYVFYAIGFWWNPRGAEQNPLDSTGIIMLSTGTPNKAKFQSGLKCEFIW